MKQTWSLPQRADTTLITAIDAHAAGEPLRIITGGLPELPGATILERRRALHEQFDYVRQALMWEPRGHFNMYGCVLTPPVTPEADLGVLFMHNQGYSTMCGHGIIALTTALFDCGVREPSGPQSQVTFDTPAGLVRATAHHRPDGSVERVSFVNVPSFVLHRDVSIDVPEYGSIVLDVAFGGAFYAILPAERVGLRVRPDQTAQLVAAAETIKRAINASLPITHPHEHDLSFLYGVILTDQPEDPQHHSRNICVFAAAEVDRSPTGTGVSARLALHHAKGELNDGQTIAIESILGRDSAFGGRVIAQTTVGPHAAIVPEVSGSAFVVGQQQFILDPRDTLGRGFLLEQK
jgi:proline racemase